MEIKNKLLTNSVYQIQKLIKISMIQLLWLVFSRFNTKKYFPWMLYQMEYQYMILIADLKRN
jgi:hypothetical protein